MSRRRRNFLFALKTGLLFALVMMAVLVGTLFLFMHVAGNQLVMELGRLRALDGVLAAQTVERMLQDPRYDRDILQQHLREEGRRRDLEITFYGATPGALPSEEVQSEEVQSEEAQSETLQRPADDGHAHQHRLPLSARLFARQMSYPFERTIQGRRCTFFGPPSFDIQVPILHQGSQVAHLEINGSRQAHAVHTAFRKGIIRIGFIALIAITALVIYLTTPLRRMSRSMDRIAAGELDHRVPVRGHDEVATMGHSFNAMADRISAMLRGQKELVAGVSHELRSPLTRMKMGLELLRGGGDRGRHLRALEEEIDHLDALVGELISASRYDLGAAPLEWQDIDVRRAAHEALGRLSPKPPGPARASTDSRPGTADPPTGDLTLCFDLEVEAVHADGPLLQRIFTNLLQNASRYAPDSAVHIGTRRRDDRIEVSVRDHGPGVAPEHLAHLFEPFYRADPSRSRSTGAVGLGLMIVQRAVAGLGGQVRATSPAGEGLTVTFDLAPPVADNRSSMPPSL